MSVAVPKVMLGYSAEYFRFQLMQLQSPLFFFLPEYMKQRKQIIEDFNMLLFRDRLPGRKEGIIRKETS